MRLRPPATLLVLLGLLAASCPPAAADQGDALLPQVVPAESAQATPQGFRVSAGEAVRIASRVGEVRRERADGGSLSVRPGVPLYGTPRVRWEVGFERAGGDRVVEVHVDGRTGAVLEVWTGPQVISLLARGYEPSVGGAVLNSPYVWVPLCLLFLVPFLDPRRPLRLLHLDLLVMLGFGVSQLFLNRGEIELSVPLAYPFLAYLLVRLLVAGFRPREGRGRLVPVVPVSFLAVALVLLLGFRVALNVTDSNVIDVGYASVVGADRILHGEELYIDNEFHGDAYGPLNYVAYIPFELVFPSTGTWDDVPAAHAAALSFDLLTVLGLFLLGLRLRGGREGRLLGTALAFAWAAYPYSTYVLQSNTNDGLVAMILVYAVLALGSPPARGALVALGTAVKFIPLALAPLFAAGTGERGWAAISRFAVPLILLLAAAVAAYLPDGGVLEMWETTIGFQLERESPFSLWGLHGSLEPLQTVVKAAAVGLALTVFALPRSRDAIQVAALGAAVLIGFQLAGGHWFYFYLAWFAPLALVAILGRHALPSRAPETLRARSRSGQPA